MDNNAELIQAPDQRVQEYYKEARFNDISKRLSVPVDDDEIRKKLRSISQPAEKDNETREERRARLIKYLVENQFRDAPDNIQNENHNSKESDRRHCLIEGPPYLVRARQEISSFIIKYRSNIQLSDNKQKNESFSQLELYSSQSGFQRPISSVKVIPNLDIVATGDWSGEISLIQLKDSMPKLASISNTGQISSMAVYDTTIATGYMDGKINLHTLKDSTEIFHTGKLSGHDSRVSCLDFHPFSSFLVSSSHDKHWALWDCTTNQCLLKQGGHKKGLNVLKASADGSLLLSGGAEGKTHIWDLRSGVLVATCGGHAGEILGASWNPVLYNTNMEFITAGGDNRCLVWDLRNTMEPKKVIYAHKSSITDVLYDKTGQSLTTASLDGIIKVWDRKNNFRYCSSIEAGTRIMSLDIAYSNDQPLLVAGRWDRMIDVYRCF